MDQKFFRIPFADGGDQTAIPDDLDPSGFVSFDTGYGFDYERDRATDPAAKAIERAKMNYLFFAVTEALQALQTRGLPEWITAANNGGAAYPYADSALVLHGGALYISLQAANTEEPGTGAQWASFASILKNAITTPPQFNDTTKIASTAFVQRALGSLRGYLGVTASLVMSATHIGVAVQFSGGAAGQTITLPDPLTVAMGSVVFIRNQGTVDITIARTGAAFIVVGETQLTSLVLQPGESIAFYTPTDSWYTLYSTAELPYLRQFSRSLASNGFQRLPGGLVLQWGNATTNASGVAVVNYPMVFPNAVMIAGTSDSETVAASACYGAVSLTSTSQLTLTYARGGAAADAGFVFWWAIGR